MSLGAEVGLSPGDIVLDGDSANSKKGGTAPPILAHVYCGQTVGWIKMKLGMEVGLGLGHNGDPALLPQRGTAPIFGPCPLWPNDWMDEDATWYGGRPRLRRHCVTWGSSSP